MSNCLHNVEADTCFKCLEGVVLADPIARAAATYQSAEWYDCWDTDVLTHTSPEDAITELLDFGYTKGESIEAQIAKACPITVTAYVQEQVSQSWIDQRCAKFEACFAEQFSTDYGDPNSGDNELNERVFEKARNKLHLWIRELLASATVRACRKVGERTYTADEVLAMMREENLHWFEEQS